MSTWQILVNRSGFPGPVANLALLAITALVAIPTASKLTTQAPLSIIALLTLALLLGLFVAFRESVPASAEAYTMMVMAGLLSGIAVWQLNDVLAQVSDTRVGGLIILMMVAQIGTAAAYHIAMQLLAAGTISLQTIAAFLMAVGAGLLLPR
ncbi:MAG: hypothetical protein Q8P19_04490 [bacterium]|nr:hypothetical protein [bacterium]